MTTATKLEFKESDLGCYPSGEAYENDLYRIVHYDYLYATGYTTKKDCWAAYHRIYNKREKVWMFGDSCEYDPTNRTKFYETREQAFDACQRHFEREAK